MLKTLPGLQKAPQVSLRIFGDTVDVNVHPSALSKHPGILCPLHGFSETAAKAQVSKEWTHDKNLKFTRQQSAQVLSVNLRCFDCHIARSLH